MTLPLSFFVCTQSGLSLLIGREFSFYLFIRTFNKRMKQTAQTHSVHISVPQWQVLPSHAFLRETKQGYFFASERDLRFL